MNIKIQFLNNLCEFTTRTHKLKGYFVPDLYYKSDSKVGKFNYYVFQTKTIPRTTQIFNLNY